MSFRARFRLLIVLTLLLIALTTFTVGKYITTIQKPGTVTFNAKLAENVMLVESRINRKADGIYETTSETITGAQSYTLIPGLDVPKDPHIVITGKTEIPAYLYIEIVNDTIDTYNGQSVITYDIAAGWSQSTRAAQHGGTVYQYDTKLDKASAKATYYILKDNKVTVSQHIKHADTDGADLLTFYAYLVEATN